MKTLTILAAVALLGAEPATPDADKVFLYWEINSSPGLPGGPTPSQVAAGKTPVSRSAKEIEILKTAEAMRNLTYKKTHAYYLVSEPGGEPRSLFEAGYELSLAQARVSWATGRASTTVARLEQAEEFAAAWEDAESAQYASDGRSISSLLSDQAKASDASVKAKIALDRVRNALKKLGYDLSDVAKQPRIGIPKRKSPNGE